MEWELAMHGAPTLAGFKAGSLIQISVDTLHELFQNMRTLNSGLRTKGLSIYPLRQDETRALILLYRQSQLEMILQEPAVWQFLREYGYETPSVGACLKQLSDGMQGTQQFPHEIGIFLGYPLEDVTGFIQNRGKNSSLTGYWKVYNDPEAKRRLFDRYTHCRTVYTSLFSQGKSIIQLARSA